MSDDLTKRLLNLGESIDDAEKQETMLGAKLDVLKDKFKKKGFATPKAVSTRILAIEEKTTKLENEISKEMAVLEDKYYE